MSMPATEHTMLCYDALASPQQHCMNPPRKKALVKCQRWCQCIRAHLNLFLSRYLGATQRQA